MRARKRSTRVRNAPPLPWKYSTTGFSRRGGTCQTITLSPSLVLSATSWASGRPAMAGGVCSRSGKYIPHGHNEEGWNGGRYGVYHDLDTWRSYMSAAGFVEINHYYRPTGLPR